MTVKPHIQVNLNDVYRIFFEALKYDSIDALVEAAFNIFNLPVILTNENYKLICQYPKQKTGEEIWDTLLEKKVLPLSTVEEYQKEYLESMDRCYRPFYANSGLVKNCPRIFGEVYEGEQIYGHVAVFMFDSPLYPNDIDVVQVFVDALKMLMVPRKNRNIASLSSYLNDLLEPDTAPQVCSLATRSLALSLRGTFALMVTPVGNSASQRAFATMVISQIPTIYRSSVSTVYNGCIVTLLGMMKGGDYTEKEKDFFSDVVNYLSPANHPSGISQPFSNLLEMRGRFHQAHMTALLTDKPFEIFDRLFPDQMFELVCRNVDADMFIHPLLKQLRDYDSENNTEYFKTLMIYSLSFHNRESSAAKLCIHRNTLLYRLNRIEDIFDFSIEDPAKAIALLNSFQLWRVHQKNVTDNKNDA
jgi:hypothetical protein